MVVLNAYVPFVLPRHPSVVNELMPLRLLFHLEAKEVGLLEALRHIRSPVAFIATSSGIFGVTVPSA